MWTYQQHDLEARVNRYGELKELSVGGLPVIASPEPARWPHETIAFPIVGTPDTKGMVEWYGERLPMNHNGVAPHVPLTELTSREQEVSFEWSYSGWDIATPLKPPFSTLPSKIGYYPCTLSKTFSFHRDGMDVRLSITNDHFKPIPFNLGWQLELYQPEENAIIDSQEQRLTTESLNEAAFPPTSTGTNLYAERGLTYLPSKDLQMSINGSFPHFIAQRHSHDPHSFSLTACLHPPSLETGYFHGQPGKQYSILLPDETRTYEISLSRE